MEPELVLPFSFPAANYSYTERDESRVDLLTVIFQRCEH